MTTHASPGQQDFSVAGLLSTQAGLAQRNQQPGLNQRTERPE
jgi:hypothetical protein